MLKLILGRAGSGKTSRILGEIKENVANCSAGNIMIVPEQYSHAAERELCKTCGDSMCLYAEILSFTRLSERVFAETGGLANHILDGAGRILAMDRAVKLCAHRLKVYPHVAGKPEYLQGLLETVDELKSCDISPEALEDKAVELTGALGNKLADIAVVLSAYNAVTDRMDPRDRFTRLAQALPDSSMMKGARVYIDGFTDFTAQESNVIKAMLPIAAKVTVALTCQSLTDDSEIFESPRQTAAALMRMAEAMGIAVEIDYHEECDDSRPEEIKFLEENLFAPGLKHFEGQCGRIEVINADTASEECELAAAKVRQLIMESGYRYRDIAVAARGFDAYETNAERIFARYGVPTYVGRKSDIMQKPVMMLLTSALEVATEGWRYESVLKYIKTGLTGLTPNQCDKLENYIFMWSIKGAMWYKNEPWGFSTEGYSSAAGSEDALLDEMNALRVELSAPLIKLSESGKKAQDVKGQILAMYGFMEDIGLAARLEFKAEQFEEKGDRQMSAEYLQLWSIILQAMEQCVAGEGETLMSQKEFAGIFRLVLSQYSVGTIPVSLDRVGMGEMDRMRSRHFKCLLVLGATDESLPVISGVQGLFSDAERERLIKCELPLSNTANDRLRRELGLIYNTFSMASERLIIMWPTVGADGKGKRQSTIVARICEMFGADPYGAGRDFVFRAWARRPCIDLALSAGRHEMNPAAKTALNALKGEDRLIFDKLRARAQGRKPKLTPDRAAKLFGAKMTLSASRLETYGRCHYSYFMQYGLKAKNARKAEFDAPVAGDFMHFVLENVIRDLKMDGDLKTVAESRWRSLTDKYIDAYIKDILLDFRDRTERFKYLFSRLRAETFQIVGDMLQELAKSEFEPLDFEMKFRDEGQLPPVNFSGGGINIALTGIVDRVDGWRKGDTLYLRVMDYKTGMKDFKLSEVWYGLGMQMLLYLFALRDTACDYYQTGSIEPAGVLYAPAREIYLLMDRDSTDKQIQKEREKKLVRKGALLWDAEMIDAMEEGEEKQFLPVGLTKDGALKGDSLFTPEQMDKLSRHIARSVITMGGEIASGNIEVTPVQGATACPCGYCGFMSACQIEQGAGQGRYIESLKNSQVFELIDRELEDKAGEDNG